jgi:phage-related protein (TIGR01555 family)
VLDAWTNARTGTGTNRSKQSGAQPLAQLLSYTEALQVYQASDTAQRIVDLVPSEATRAGLDVRVPDDHEAGESICAIFDDLKAATQFKDAHRKLRAFGGAAVLVNVTDGVSDPAMPINEGGLISIDSLTVFDPLEATVLEWNAIPTDKAFGKPAVYSINPQAIGVSAAQVLSRVHASRVIHFSGPMLSRAMLNANRGFGMSVLDMVWSLISRFDQNYDSAGALVDDFAQAVFKIKGLAQAMASDKGHYVKKRLELIDAYRSTLRGIAIDAENEDFERKATPLTGLPELMDRFAQRLASAIRWPVSVLMGTAPAGMNATGASDMRLWYDMIDTERDTVLRPAYERLAHLITLSKSGPTKGKTPENFAINFRPLWQPSELEQADVRVKMSQADQVYLTAGVVDVDEIRKSRFGGDAFSVSTEIEEPETGTEEPGDQPDPTEALAASEGVARMGPDGQPVQVMPGKVAPTGAGAAKLQDTALNGAQVASAVEIVKAVLKKELPRESGISMLVEFFNLDPAAATRIMGPVGFVPVVPEPPPAFGSAPGAKPAAPPEPKTQPPTPAKE